MGNYFRFEKIVIGNISWRVFNKEKRAIDWKNFTPSFSNNIVSIPIVITVS